MGNGGVSEGRRGFGVAAGLDPEVTRELGAVCAEFGYTSLWANDHPAASGLETVAQFAEGAPDLDLGVGAIALDRHDPLEIADSIYRLELDPEKLLIAFGAGFSKKPLTVMQDGVARLREALPDGTRVLVAAMGPKMCALAGEIADGVFLNWMTPSAARVARERIVEGATRVGRDAPPVLGYVRVAVDDRANERMAKEESFYRELHDGYRRHFERLDAEVGTVGVSRTDGDNVGQLLDEYEQALDEVVVRALASAKVESMSQVAEAAAPAVKDKI